MFDCGLTINYAQFLQLALMVACHLQLHYFKYVLQTKTNVLDGTLQCS
jgi:hypothetical protein